MRKIFSSVLLLILLALFGFTYYCSSKTEEAFKAQVSQVNRSYPGLLQVELRDYQRGLLVSEVQTSISMKDRDSLALQHQIRHFPWGVRVITRLAEQSPLAAELAELLSVEQLQLQTDVGLNGASKTHFALDQLRFSDGTGEVLINEVMLDCNLDGHLSSGNLQFRLDTLELQATGQQKVILSGVDLDSDFAEQQGLLLGGGEFKLDRLLIEQQEQVALELTGLAYRASTLMNAGQLASELDLTLAELSLGGETFTDGQLQLKVAGIDVAAVRELQESAKQLQAELISQKVDPLILQLQLLGLYSQFFKEGLTLTLERLALRADEGILQGQGRLELQESDIAVSSPVAFDKLKGQFQLDIDRAVFNAGFRLFANLQRKGRTALNPAVLDEQAEQLAGGLMQKGMLVRRDGGYRLELSVDQGQGSLNGNPFNL